MSGILTISRKPSCLGVVRAGVRSVFRRIRAGNFGIGFGVCAILRGIGIGLHGIRIVIPGCNFGRAPACQTRKMGFGILRCHFERACPRCDSIYWLYGDVGVFYLSKLRPRCVDNACRYMGVCRRQFEDVPIVILHQCLPVYMPIIKRTLKISHRSLR
jgi:hypothetical protein